MARILAFLLLIAITSCKKDTINTVYVPSWLRQMIPYTNGQSVSFINSSGGIIQVTVTESNSFVEKSSCPGCTPYVREESIKWKFFSGSSNFADIQVDNRPNVFMSIMSPLDNYQIGGGFDFLTQDGSSQFICSGPRQTCIPSITLNGKTFTNVLEITNGSPVANRLYRAYYTLSKGLVGYIYGNGDGYALNQ